MNDTGTGPGAQPSVDLSICVVNHRTPALTLACLCSVVDNVHGLSTEIYVVNNTPDADGSFAQSVSQIPGVTLIENEQPLGFAANQNQMLSRASGRYLMPLNSDTVVLPDALSALVAFMDAHPDVGIAGPKLLNADGSLQPSARHFATPFKAFMEVSRLWRLFKRQTWMAAQLPMCHPHDVLLDVDWLTGACYIVRKEAAQSVGLYDADTFVMYGEDLDWCWRMRQAGWAIMLCPDARVVHLERRSPLENRQRIMWQGGLKFDRKTGRGRALIPIYVAACAGLLLRLPLSHNLAQARESLAIIKLLLYEIKSILRR